MLDLVIVIILKRVNESIFFQINNITACKVKDKKAVANSLIAFSVLKIIHPFQGKKLVKLKLQVTRIFNYILTGSNTNYTTECNSNSVVLYLKTY